MYKFTSWLKPLISGLWSNNPALVQLLGLCPLLGISNSTVNAIGLSVATIFVLVLSNFFVSICRKFISNVIRIPVFVILIAALTTSIELIMQAFTYELYQILGIFIPLIVTNCIILGRAEACAAKNNPLVAVIDGLMTGLGFAIVLIFLGMLRELIGQGTLFDRMDLLFSNTAVNWKITINKNYPNCLFFILPPGAFVTLGFLIALKNIIDVKMQTRIKKVKDPKPERIRIYT